MAVIEADAVPVSMPVQRVNPHAGTLMALIERVASDPNFPIEKLDKLLDVKERWDRAEAVKAFEAALAAAKGEIKPILKRHEVDYQNRNSPGRTNYKHEDYGDIAEHIDPILAKHGLSYRHRPHQDGKWLTITCILSHRDGHSEETSLGAPNDESGNKNGIQAIGSTATYLQRYTVKLALGLAASRDNDGRSYSDPKGGDEQQAGPKLISQKQAADLDAMISEVGANKATFLKVLRVDTLEDLPESKLPGAIQRLKDKQSGVAR